MFAALTAVLFAAGAAFSLAYRIRRGGWFGVPIGVTAILAVWLLWSDMPGTMELPSLLMGSCIAGIASVGLPRLDQVVAIAAGTIVSYIFIAVIPAHDSPLGHMVGASVAGFAMGSLLSIARSLLMSTRDTPPAG